ncbi:MAG TPA: S-layer homology domain-containing protein [Candidatus Gracilibacteria bacterium]|nr:S-layer homology domain-containing protein [Candidatus Gracilibacteria bacterium]
MRKKTVIIAFLSLALACTAAASSFDDILVSNPLLVPIDFVTDSGYMGALSGNNFEQGQALTRAQAVEIVVDTHNIATPPVSGSTGFDDVLSSDSYAPSIVAALNEGIIQSSPDNKFYPVRTVTRAEFAKMVLLANSFQVNNWGEDQLYADVPAHAWFAPYLNYAGKAGLLRADRDGNLYPSTMINRGEVADVIFKIKLIVNRTDNTFLTQFAQDYQDQLEANLDSNLVTAKNIADKLVSITQQTYRNTPIDRGIVARAKIARAYNFLINGKVAKIHNLLTRAQEWKALTISKAQEANSVANSQSFKNKATEIVQLASEI